jgi:hypothetical protein
MVLAPRMLAYDVSVWRIGFAPIRQAAVSRRDIIGRLRRLQGALSVRGVSLVAG